MKRTKSYRTFFLVQAILVSILLWCYVVLNQNKTLPASKIIEVTQIQTPKKNKLPFPKQTLKSETYIWRLADHFEVINNQITQRKNSPEKVRFLRYLEWNPFQNKSTRIQLSRRANFQPFRELKSNTHFLKIDEVYLGDNFWRITNDSNVWSSVQKFEVLPKFLEGYEPRVIADSQPIVLDAATVKTPVHLITKEVQPAGFLIQASTDSNFSFEKTKIFWTPKKSFYIKFYKPGEYFYRFKTVTTKQELSSWSGVTKFKLVLPKPHHPPKLTLTKKAPIKKKTEIQEQVVINKALPEQAPEKTRTPAAVYAQTAISIAVPKIVYPNEKHTSSRLSTTGFLWSLFSSEHYYSGEPMASASGLGIEGFHWRDKHGLQGNLKTGVFGLNKTGRTQDSLRDLEARYHYRFFLDTPWRGERELQLSLFAGLETYRNSGGIYLSQYDLAKFGTSIEFPLGSRWITGGEFVYGLTSDRSQKFEVSGKANYFLDRNWSVGMGYRIHLIEVGSAKSTPKGNMPYREGYTEGFSVLNYHF